MPDMKVLEVCAFGAPSPGNFIAALLALQSKLEREGHEVIYVFLDNARDKEWCQKIRKTNKVYFLKAKMARINPKIYCVLRKIYFENNIDVVHTHFELFDMPATIMAPKNTRIIWHLHDPLKENYTKTSRLRKLLYKIQYSVIGKRAQLISVSKEHALFAKVLGFPASNIYYVPNGIDISRLSSCKRRGVEEIHSITNQDAEEQLLMFGWDVYRKGVDVALEAMEIANVKNKLLVIGQGSCQQYVEDFVKQKPIVNGRIKFSGPVSDIASLYSKTNCFLHISRAEGLSYALLEAIYAGIPVICSDIAENAFAKEFDNVYFVPVGDPLAVANKIDEVCKLQVSEQAIRSNRAIILEKYSLEKWSNTIIGFYSDDVEIESCRKMF